MRYAFIAGLIAATQAVKQNMEQYESKYSVDLLQGKVASWYETVAKPFMDEHREALEAQAKANVIAENENWWSLTCEDGTECREQAKADIMDQIRDGWKTLFDGWRQGAEAQMLITKNLIQDNYDIAMECERNNRDDCIQEECDKAQPAFENILLQIAITEDKIKELQDQWDDLEEARLALEEECPEADFESVLVEYGRM